MYATSSEGLANLLSLQELALRKHPRTIRSREDGHREGTWTYGARSARRVPRRSVPVVEKSEGASFPPKLFRRTTSRSLVGAYPRLVFVTALYMLRLYARVKKVDVYGPHLS